MTLKLTDGTTKSPPKELFEYASQSNIADDFTYRPEQSFWQDAWRGLRKNKAAIVGLCTIIVVLLLAVFGPFMNSHGYDEQNIARTNLPPKIPVLENIPFIGLNGVDSRGINQYEAKGIEECFWFGTDELGRDLWTRVWEGTRISLYIAFLAATIDLIIGVAYGAVSAFYGGRTDTIMQRIIEVLVGIPGLIVNILLILILKPGIISITIAMVIVGWISMARIVRAQILKLKTYEYVLASRTLGASNQRLIWKHLIPNTLGPIIVATTFTIPGAIFTEALLD